MSILAWLFSGPIAIDARHGRTGLFFHALAWSLILSVVIIGSVFMYVATR